MYPFVGYLVLLIPVTPRELVIGLSVMCCSPTVLASSAILAEQVSSEVVFTVVWREFSSCSPPFCEYKSYRGVHFSCRCFVAV